MAETTNLNKEDNKVNNSENNSKKNSKTASNIENNNIEKEQTESKQENTKRKFYIILLIIVILALILATFLFFTNKVNTTEKYDTIASHFTIEGEKLVFKSTGNYTKIMEYEFEENALNRLKVYERFDKIEDFENVLKAYENRKDIKVLYTNSENREIEIEKIDFGSDRGKTYEEIYDKYIVQIVGAYEVI